MTRHERTRTPPPPELRSDDAESVGTSASDGTRPLARRGRLLVRLCLAMAAMGFATLLGEVVVRLFVPQVLFPRYVTDGGFGIRVNVRSVRYRHTSPEVSVEFRHNAQGMRSDREYAFTKPPGVTRILGLGDSFTQGYEVEVEETYLYRLERLLRDRGLNVEVLNLGVSGFGTAEELILLREYGTRFDPDVVIVGYFTNDILDNVRSNLFRLDERGGLERAAHEYLPAIGLRDRLYSFPPYRWLSEHSHLFAMVREQAAQLIKRKLVDEHLGGGERRDDGYAVRLTGRLLDEIKDDCQRENRRFLVLDIPPPNLRESPLLRDSVHAIEPDEVVRTASKLQAEGPNAYLYRKRGHLHWTPRAHELAAELLAERLLPLLSAPTPPPDP